VQKTLNIRGTFLMTQSFLAALPTPETPAKIVSLSSGVAYEVMPALSAYGISKLAVFNLMTYVALEHPNVVAVALHPGIVVTEMTVESFRPFAHDTFELVGGTAVWLSSFEESRNWLSGRYVSANWNVDDLVSRKDEIVGKELLKMNIMGTLGVEQFKK
jgi:NAD(P)-dependent dehydrogenase (short-subunit alcohol dehydrogenase family)